MSSENAKSLKVLDELMQKLTISKEADEIKAASSALASFINGRIEDLDTPTKYVSPPAPPLALLSFMTLPLPLLWESHFPMRARAL